MIVAAQSDTPDIVALVALAPLPAGLVIHLTDNAFDGTSFATNEGTTSLTLPEVVSAGTVFGFGPNLLYGDSWNSELDKGFSLAAAGDTIIVYCTETIEAQEKTYLSALSYSGPFLDAGLSDSYGTTSSALPESITDFAVALTHLDNYRYIGSIKGDIDQLKSFLVDEGNWEGSNSIMDSSTFVPADFEIES